MLKVKLKVVREYNDIRLGRLLKSGEILETTEERGRYLLSLGYVTILEIYKFKNGKNHEAINSADEGKDQVCEDIRG